MRRHLGFIFRSGTSVILTITLVCITSLASAQAPAPFERFIGSWAGKGKLMGADAEFMMTWEWVLDGRFVHLTFQNKMSASDGEARILKAQAFYKPEEGGHFSGTWFDSRGMVLPLTASIEADTLTTLWGSPETEQGRTVYRLLEPGRFEVEDFVLRDGKWRRFGHAIYHPLAAR